jgi:hypothetical protein
VRAYRFRSSGRQAPPCSAGSTTANLLKIRPYSQKRIQSGAKPVVIEFGATVDARVTGYAWRKHVRYGTRKKRSSAGVDSITLRGRLAKRRYYAVVVGRSASGERLCDARRMEVK